MSAPRQHTAPAIVTTPITLNSTPAPSAPYTRVSTVVSTNPNAPLTAAPTSPIAPLLPGARSAAVTACPG
ncbi:hypothetical protein [Actinoplanes sp. NBRC 103695]|uniref:hypothetical protein n=1 Tax=Actinoplanes sp. NBRC 103695 TaxID=3032202 RepID=UPI002554F996|nr:hypothetical protein [Actinoplanes sp. NBRC 103695]